VLDAQDGVVERLGAENDRERLGLALLVERTDTLGKTSLGHSQAGARSVQRRPRLVLLPGKALALRAQPLEPGAGAGELRVERAELRLGGGDLPSEGLIRLPQLVRFAAQAVRRLRSGCWERAREGCQARDSESPETGTWRSHGAAP
jgi:hypothetical protein